MKCDPNQETLSLRLRGQNTSKPNVCQTNFLDHMNVFDFVDGGSKVYDGNISGHDDEVEISLLGSCFEVRHLGLYRVLFFYCSSQFSLPK